MHVPREPVQQPEVEVAVGDSVMNEAECGHADYESPTGALRCMIQSGAAAQGTEM